jgi:hypothetical protein
MILSSHHVVNCWGNPKQELDKFVRYNLFSNDDIQEIEPKNIQKDLKKWFNDNNPKSPDRKTKPNESYSLQLAIKLSLNRWLDKQMTMADWGCGIGPELKTYTSTNNYGDRKRIEDAKEYRKLMSIYAVCDCMAVTKLKEIIETKKPLTPPDTIQYEELSEAEQVVDSKQNENVLNLRPMDNMEFELEVQVQDDLYQINDVEMQDQPLYQVSEGGHVPDELVLLNNNEDWENNSLPDIMKLHLPLNRTGVHGQNEPSYEMENIVNVEQELMINNDHQSKQLTRNQKKNQKKRINRYQFEVIRQLYRRFTTNHVKDILIAMNIYWVNINVVHHTLFIGLKDQRIQQQVDELLHDKMFNEDHYRRIYQRNHRRRRH